MDKFKFIVYLHILRHIIFTMSIVIIIFLIIAAIKPMSLLTFGLISIVIITIAVVWADTKLQKYKDVL